MESLKFQPTRPLRGATLAQKFSVSIHTISTHAPLAGRDPISVRSGTATEIFQPTRPLRGATISNASLGKVERFQPTRPLRGATLLGLGIYKFVKISTHAPLAGRDLSSLNPPAFPLRFQPTRPLRGATIPVLLKIPRISYFNPRAPCGARQQKCTNHYAHFCDNRQISDAFAQNAACQGILLLFDAGKPCGFWVRTAQVISARLCFAL